MNFCKIGFHKYVYVGEQRSINLVNSISGVQLTRIVRICKLCGKIKYTSYDISLDRKPLYSDSKLWKPTLDMSLQYRKIKINKIMKVL
jgi:hypothetical protein